MDNFNQEFDDLLHCINRYKNIESKLVDLREQIDEEIRRRQIYAEKMAKEEEINKMGRYYYDTKLKEDDENEELKSALPIDLSYEEIMKQLDEVSIKIGKLKQNKL